MPPQDPNQAVQPEQPNPLAVMQQGERVIFELKRHPAGILIVYFMTAVLLIVLALSVFGLAPSVVSESNKNQVLNWGGAGFLIFAVLCLLFNWIISVVYWGNRWILTDDSLTQISQTTLFHKETSSLGLVSLEDVTAEQNGILSKLFRYGTLKAETAGHRSKFVFIYCPQPTYYAQKILEAREAEVMRHGHDPRLGTHPPQPLPQQPYQPAPEAAYQPPNDPTNPPSVPPQSGGGGFTSNYS